MKVAVTGVSHQKVVVSTLAVPGDGVMGSQLMAGRTLVPTNVLRRHFFHVGSARVPVDPGLLFLNLEDPNS